MPVAVQRSRDRAGDMGPMAVGAGVVDGLVVVAEVPAVDVVDVPVAVVVDAVVRHARRPPRGSSRRARRGPDG